MRHRLLVPSLVLLLALAVTVVPASAGKSAAAATLIDNGGCSFTVTYTWSGLSGTGLIASVSLGYREAGGLNVLFARADFPDHIGSGGSVSATFTLTGPPTATPYRYFGLGNLFKAGKKNSPYTLSSVRDSVVYSGDSAPQECGRTVMVS